MNDGLVVFIFTLCSNIETCLHLLLLTLERFCRPRGRVTRVWDEFDDNDVMINLKIPGETRTRYLAKLSLPIAPLNPCGHSVHFVKATSRSLHCDKCSPSAKFSNPLICVRSCVAEPSGAIRHQNNSRDSNSHFLRATHSPICFSRAEIYKEGRLPVFIGTEGFWA